MSMTRIYADGRREDYEDAEWPQRRPAESCVADEGADSVSFSADDAVIAVIAVGSVAMYFAGVFG